MNIIRSIAFYIRNKFVSIAVLVASIFVYSLLPSGMPFVEMAYTGVTILGVITLAPILRLLVFNEVAVYAETGGLKNDLACRDFTPALCHYWFATFICYAAPIVCLATISK